MERAGLKRLPLYRLGPRKFNGGLRRGNKTSVLFGLPCRGMPPWSGPPSRASPGMLIKSPCRSGGSKAGSPGFPSERRERFDYGST
jgi:hypothetical protein